MDLLFRMEDGVFSYRVAGICVHNGCVLLQTTTGEDRSFVFPGGMLPSEKPMHKL